MSLFLDESGSALPAESPLMGIGHLTRPFEMTMPELGIVEATSEEREEPPKPREYGLALATFVVISSMVGVGVLTTSGYTVAAVGSNQLMLGLWLVGGVVALCGAMTVAELAAALPASGGDYVYLLRGVRPGGGVSVGMGLVPDRLRGADRGLGVCRGLLLAGPARSAWGDGPGALTWGSRRWRSLPSA